MKKLLFILALAVSVLSCRSVKTEGSVATHHYSNEADTMAVVSISEREDSSSYFHGLIDSLSSELVNIQKQFHDIYMKDSIFEAQHVKDSESVKDTTWIVVNPDGTITYHHYRERNVTSHVQTDRFKQQIMKESQAVIDSLIDKNEHLRTQVDSMSQYVCLVDSVSQYRAKIDSLSSIIEEHEHVTVVKNSVWDKIRASIITAVFLLLTLAGLYCYLRFFRR